MCLSLGASCSIPNSQGDSWRRQEELRAVAILLNAVLRAAAEEQQVGAGEQLSAKYVLVHFPATYM